MKFSGKARTMLVGTAILAAGGLIGGGVAYAAVKAPTPTPLSSSDTIYACVTSAGVIRGSGYERLNAPPPTCYLSTDTVRSWKAQGPAGALGPTGPAGLTGQTGAPGTNGMDGSTGAQGQTGLAGAAGLDGKDGAQGLTGPKGDTGSAGAPGLQGPAGDVGPAGKDGASGREVVTDAFTNTDAVKQLEVPCPAGKVIISGGAIAGSGDQMAVLEWSAPFTGASWAALGRELNGIPGYNWTLTVFAICVLP